MRVFETFGEFPCPLLCIRFALTPSYLDPFRKGLEIDIVGAIGLEQPEDQHDGYTRHRRQAKRADRQGNRTAKQSCRHRSIARVRPVGKNTDQSAGAQGFVNAKEHTRRLFAGVDHTRSRTRIQGVEQRCQPGDSAGSPSGYGPRHPDAKKAT